MTQQISEAYVLGIKEGRSFLTSCPDMTLTEMRDARDAARRNAGTHGGEMAELFRGERDFWRNQINKKQENRS